VFRNDIYYNETKCAHYVYAHTHALKHIGAWNGYMYHMTRIRSHVGTVTHTHTPGVPGVTMRARVGYLA
jgi:hypothetical protein